MQSYGSKETFKMHTAYSIGKQYTWQSLYEEQQGFTGTDKLLPVKPCMYVIFHSNFAVYIVCWCCKICTFHGFVWTDCKDV